ncbi:MAG: hypothetical protein HFE67_00915 [Erysipelotrichaceae bacterium]|nr:hypothetical protein [Erysipelotrichaceae bacterium]
MENNVQVQHQNQKGIYALCLGILSCVGSLAYYPGWIFALICGICAIIFSTQVKWNVTNGSAIAGFVLGIIGTTLSSVLFIGCSLWYLWSI